MFASREVGYFIFIWKFTYLIIASEWNFSFPFFVDEVYHSCHSFNFFLYIF